MWYIIHIPVLLFWLICTSFANQVLFSVVLVCSSVCTQHHLKSYERIVMEFHGGVRGGNGKKLISDFYMDEGLRWPLCHWLFQNIVHLHYTLHEYTFFFFSFLFNSQMGSSSGALPPDPLTYMQEKNNNHVSIMKFTQPLDHTILLH